MKNSIEGLVILVLLTLLGTACGATPRSYPLGDAEESASPSVGKQVVLSSFLPPAGYVGTTYTYSVRITGGVSPLTVDITGLPPGLGFDPTTNTVSGTPTEVGTYLVTGQVRDATLAEDVSQAVITIEERDTRMNPSRVKLRRCQTPHSGLSLVLATATGIKYNTPEGWKGCTIAKPIVHETYRDLLKVPHTAPSITFAPTPDPLPYSVLIGQQLLVSGTLDQADNEQVFSLSEESLKISFASWRAKEVVTVRVGEGNQSIDVEFEISFLPTPIYFNKAPELIHAGFKTFEYSQASIDTIFGGDEETMFIAEGRELRNVSESPITISLRVDPTMFETLIEHRRESAYLKGDRSRTVHSMLFYGHQNCPDNAVYYQAPAGLDQPCQYVQGGLCPLNASSERSYVCAPTSATTLQVIPFAETYQFKPFTIETTNMLRHDDTVTSREPIGVVGVWRDSSATTPALFGDNVNNPLLGVTARELTIPPRSSVWVGFGIKTPAFKITPPHVLSFTDSAGASISYEDRAECSYSSTIFDRYSGQNVFQSTIKARRHVEAEKSLSITLNGAVLGEIVESQSRPLFGPTNKETFAYSNEATHNVAPLTFHLPSDYCPNVN